MDAAEQKRMCASEHPRETVRRHLYGYYYLLKGKAELETALLYMAYNMRWAINMVGGKTAGGRVGLRE